MTEFNTMTYEDMVLFLRRTRPQNLSAMPGDDPVQREFLNAGALAQWERMITQAAILFGVPIADAQKACGYNPTVYWT